MCMMTKSEKQIMDLLWSVDEPLSCTEIIQMSGDKTWKDSYVHSLIKSLMKKDLVEVVSFELVSRSYARKFVPKLSKEGYCLREYLNESPDNSFLKLFTAYLDRCDSADEVRALEDAIKPHKKERSDCFSPYFFIMSLTAQPITIIPASRGWYRLLSYRWSRPPAPGRSPLFRSACSLARNSSADRP